LPKRAPKTHVPDGTITSKIINERGTDGGEEEENGGDRPTNEAALKSLVPASTITRFNMALKTKGDSHDQTSTNENPTLIRLASAINACTCHAVMSLCLHQQSVRNMTTVQFTKDRGITSRQF
jgi:hypothetical protein